MNERTWVSSIISNLEKELQKLYPNIFVADGHKLAYANEILAYDYQNEPIQNNLVRYETDILIYEKLNESHWKPRVVIEAKLGSVTTHDAITYSQKANTHKMIHPYLRYGVLLGNRENFPLPGRLFRHGQNFDFMLSWKSFEADNLEFSQTIEIINDEIHSSRILDEIILNSRSKEREHYNFLHRPLRLT